MPRIFIRQRKDFMLPIPYPKTAFGRGCHFKERLKFQTFCLLFMLLKVKTQDRSFFFTVIFSIYFLRKYLNNPFWLWKTELAWSESSLLFCIKEEQKFLNFLLAAPKRSWGTPEKQGVEKMVSQKGEEQALENRVWGIPWWFSD